MKEQATASAPAKEPLFSVECTTCKARLKVRSEKAIGQILACPKCNSMVMIAPPPDWRAPGAPPELATAPAANAVFRGFAWKLWGSVGVAATLTLGGLALVWAKLPRHEPLPVAQAPAQKEVAPPAPAVAAEEATEPVVEESAADTLPVDEPLAPASNDEDAAPVQATVLPETPPPAEPAVAAPAPAVEPPVAQAAPPPQSDESAVSSADDLLSKLRTPIAAIDEPRIPLADLAELLGGISACRIELDEASLASAGLSGATPAVLKLEQGTVSDALVAALGPLGLKFEPRGKSIAIFAGE